MVKSAYFNKLQLSPSNPMIFIKIDHFFPSLWLEEQKIYRICCFFCPDQISCFLVFFSSFLCKLRYIGLNNSRKTPIFWIWPDIGVKGEKKRKKKNTKKRSKIQLFCSLLEVSGHQKRAKKLSIWVLQSVIFKISICSNHDFRKFF